mmetsp:Transcript_156796/g.503184  ORF Transcript_156796/g.503184 Transcript_156796/m.503184 type:complete len:348 (+) Transcript_156796:379-1422(+)
MSREGSRRELHGLRQAIGFTHRGLGRTDGGHRILDLRQGQRQQQGPLGPRPAGRSPAAHRRRAEGRRRGRAPRRRCGGLGAAVGADVAGVHADGVAHDRRGGPRELAVGRVVVGRRRDRNRHAALLRRRRRPDGIRPGAAQPEGGSQRGRLRRENGAARRRLARSRQTGGVAPRVSRGLQQARLLQPHAFERGHASWPRAGRWVARGRGRPGRRGPGRGVGHQDERQRGTLDHPRQRGAPGFHSVHHAQEHHLPSDVARNAGRGEDHVRLDLGRQSGSLRDRDIGDPEGEGRGSGEGGGGAGDHSRDPVAVHDAAPRPRDVLGRLLRPRHALLPHRVHGGRRLGALL